MERWTKQAASYKMERLIDNAFACRVESSLENNEDDMEDPSLCQIVGQLFSSLQSRKSATSGTENTESTDTEEVEPAAETSGS